MITRSIIPTSAAAVLLAIAVAGCGSAAGSSSVAPQSGVITQQTTTASSDDDLKIVNVSNGDNVGAADYLKSLTPVRVQLAKVRRSTRAMAAGIKARDAATAGRNAMAAAAGVRRALTIARRIRPHNEPWTTVHTHLLANLAIGADYLNEMGRDLIAVNVTAIDHWNTTVVPKIKRSERWYREWAANVASFASLDGIDPPPWLMTMDRWN
jgi:hypothetical protein